MLAFAWSGIECRSRRCDDGDECSDVDMRSGGSIPSGFVSRCVATATSSVLRNDYIMVIIMVTITKLIYFITYYNLLYTII